MARAHHALLRLELQWWWGAPAFTRSPPPPLGAHVHSGPMVRGLPGLQPPEAMPPALAAREGTGWVWGGT